MVDIIFCRSISRQYDMPTVNVDLHSREGTTFLLRTLRAVVDVERGDGVWVHFNVAARANSSLNILGLHSGLNVDALRWHRQHPTPNQST